MFRAQVKKMMLEEEAARTIAAFTVCEGTPSKLRRTTTVVFLQ